MLRHTRPLVALVMLCVIGATMASKGPTPAGPHESEKTQAGAQAADDHWLRAEVDGDTDFLEQMLLPGYRSIGATGVAHSREQIIAGAVKNKDSDAMKEKVAAWRKAEPTEIAVLLHGNVAVVSFYDPALGPDKGVRSSDILVYEDGGWHAVYSQHAAAKSN